MAVRHEYQGGAVQALLSTSITDSATSFSITAVSGWPTGSIGIFLIVVDPGKTNEEKMIVQSRSGSTLTILTRGADGTTASAHAVNAVVRHVLGALDIDLVNRHAADTSIDDHTQYVHNTTARTISANHTFSGNPIFSGTPNFSGSPTFGGNPAFSGTPVFSGTPTFNNMGLVGDVVTLGTAAKAAGTSPKPARADHRHDLDLTAITNTVIPAGTMMPSASASVPTGWLLCNGQAVSRTTYAALFTAIGTGYGVGDGSTTFNVPDLRDRFICGGGPTRAHSSNGGADTVTLTTSHLPTHSHGINDPGHNHSINDPGHNHAPVNSGSFQMVISSPFGEQHNIPANPGGAGNTQATYSYLSASTTGVSNNAATTGISTQNAGSGSAVTTVPKYYAFNVLIKAH